MTVEAGFQGLSVSGGVELNAFENGYKVSTSQMIASERSLEFAHGAQRCAARPIGLQSCCGARDLRSACAARALQDDDSEVTKLERGIVVFGDCPTCCSSRYTGG